MSVNYEPQSGRYDAEIDATSSNHEHELMSFDDAHPEHMYAMPDTVDSTRAINDAKSSDLNDFFRRPVQLTHFQWSSTLYHTFNPWDLFFTNKRVSNRINNYNLARATLHLKFTINGTPFHFGRALASYVPFQGLDNLTNISSFETSSLVQLSQMPHIFLNPTTSTGGTLVIPFHHYTNQMEVPLETWSELGLIVLRQLNNLREVTGDASSVDVRITVFGWVEGISLAVPTSRNIVSLSPQSGMEDEVDEANATGVISGPATAISNAAKALSDIHTIAPYATATSKAAGMVAGAAKHFGLCKPVITRNPDPYIPRPVANMATCNVPETVAKLTVDDKQELTIDPRIAGVGNKDQLALTSISTRETYLTSFQWSEYNSFSDLLWNTRVTPMTWKDGMISDSLYLPACAAASLPFEYWSGTMKYRFQIVASAFHRGRLMFAWDPQFLSSDAGPESGNVHYSKILDIAEQTDITLQITPGQERTLLEFSTYPTYGDTASVYSNAVFSTATKDNGVLGVYVVNDLVAPGLDVHDISINVYVSTGDDFELYVPNDRYANYVFAPQSGVEGMETSGTDLTDKPVAESSEYLGLGGTDVSKVPLIFTGESIKSFRTLLKRYNFHGTLFNRGFTTPDMFTSRRCAFPMLRGAVPGAYGLTLAPDSIPYNFVNTVMLHWVTAMFSGRRGSIRWKIMPTIGNDDSHGIVTVVRTVNDNWVYTSSSATVDNSSQSTTDYSYVTQVPQGGNGMVATSTSVNPTLEFELPYYSNERFTPGKHSNFTQPSSTLLGFEGGFEVLSTSANDPKDNLLSFVAAGEDFQLYFFTGMPPIYYEPVFPFPSP